ncbi:hypothetical protein [Georgenia wangjunii]|uniref:hypothetical protein n=1 Tax=Georgenia wangjunii TaxID=3117730 RepID=UPI002F268A59
MHERSAGNADLPIEAAREALTVRRVFGEAYECDGTTVIPVAKVIGGAGMGFGNGALGGGEAAGAEALTGGEGSGGGGGFAVRARALGAYVVRDGKVTWHPALDLNRVVLGGQAVGAVVAVVLAWALRRRRR